LADSVGPLLARSKLIKECVLETVKQLSDLFFGMHFISNSSFKQSQNWQERMK
jgi:hypothetical protein